MYLHLGEHWIEIRLPSPRFLSGLYVWNYNKSVADVGRGVRRLEVALDDRIISPEGGYNLRAAPGKMDYDFRQWLGFEATPESAIDVQLAQPR